MGEGIENNNQFEPVLPVLHGEEAQHEPVLPVLDGEEAHVACIAW